MVYEYKCTVCDNVFAVSHSANAENRRMLYCPECERMRPVKKIMSRCTFILKGQNWAKDGYSGGKK
jgi:putative FmdB family regulatory protein